MRALLMISAVLTLVGCSAGIIPIGQQSAVYTVTGSGSAQISYLDGGVQSGTHSLPFRATATAPFAPNQFMINAVADEGEVTCTLRINGEVVSEQTGRAVTCSG